MLAHLQEQIQHRMEAKSLNTHALERKAGLARSAVRNILQGFSRKPSADVLASIADALDCTIDDLVGDSGSSIISNKIKPTIIARNNYTWNGALYLEAVKAISKYVEDKSPTAKSEQIISLINETYKYSLDKGSDELDRDFTKWVVGRSL